MVSTINYRVLHIPVLTSIAASQTAQQMAQMNPGAGANPFGPGQDPDKTFQAEAENLEVMEHYCILDGAEERILSKYGY